MAKLKLFNKWDIEGIEVRDPGLARYISLDPIIIPHTHGKHEHKRFGKSTIPIVERYINRLIAPGLATRRRTGRQTRSISGKKQKTIKIVERAFEIIHLKTGANPVQILVRAIEYCAPREETTRVSYGGIAYSQAVDVAPLRRLDLSLKFLVEESWKASFNNISKVEECIANELILAANNDPNSGAVRRKEEKERIASSTR
ncbi:MAG: 30S ribosomal protein S7 [Promethearchaeota archaeon]|nr:MAG: 30S ribosomal protein S7 [Candidatus Lokiarchaeota archaeon]